MKHKLKPPGAKRLKLKCDILFSNYAFKFHLRRYIVGRPELVDTWLRVMGRTPVSALFPHTCRAAGSGGGGGGGGVGGGGGGGGGSFPADVGDEDLHLIIGPTPTGDTGDDVGGGAGMVRLIGEGVSGGVGGSVGGGGGGGGVDGSGNGGGGGGFIADNICPIVSLIESIVPVMLVLFPAVHGPLSGLAAGAYTRSLFSST